jgi:hypothetical protein
LEWAKQITKKRGERFRIFVFFFFYHLPPT